MGWQLVYFVGYIVSKVNLLTQAAYARHRGCSKVAVGKAVAAGRISLVNGMIDPTVADIQWQANSRARANSGTSEQLPLGAVQAPAQTGSENGDAQSPAPRDADYMVSRTRRETAEAELAELKLAEQHGMLIRVDAVKQALANALTATRDGLLQIPSRLAAVLAAETDAAKVHELLQLELYRALEGMSTLQSSARLAGREQTT
jgi:predicted negative regulator of RcsB-dependent stress response